MRTDKGNLWTYPAPWKIITTNGDINQRGLAIMGRGVALQAKVQFGGIDKVLADHLTKEGNVPGIFGQYRIISCPVKHHWQEPADLKLIESSLLIIQSLPPDIIPLAALPRPGCGNGNRTWSEVEPICTKILDDRFIVLEYEDLQIRTHR